MKNNSLFSIVFMTLISFIAPVSLFSMEGPYKPVEVQTPIQQPDKNIQAFLKALDEDVKRVESNQPYSASKVFQLSRSVTKNLPATLTSQFNTYNDLYNKATLAKDREPFEQKVNELRTLAQGAPKTIEEKKEGVPKQLTPTPKIVPIRKVSKPIVSAKIIEGLDSMLMKYNRDGAAKFFKFFSPEGLNKALEAIEIYQQTQDKEAYRDFATAIRNHLKTKKLTIPQPLAPQLVEKKSAADKEMRELQEQLDEEFPVFLADQAGFFAVRTAALEVKKLQKFLPLIKSAQEKDKTAYQGFAQAIEQHLKKHPPIKESKEEVEEPIVAHVIHHQHAQWPGMDAPNIAYWKKTIQETQAEFDANEQQLNNAITRFLPLPDSLNKANIFNIRSIQQMNGWLCGHLLLFNALILERNIQSTNNKPLTEQLIVNTLVPRKEYNWPEFKEIYTNVTFFGYAQDKQNKSTIDPFTGLNNPGSLENFEPAFLDDQNIINLAKNGIAGVLYIIGKQEGQFILQSGTNDDAPYTFDTDATKQSLVGIAQTKQGTPYLIHFACRLAATHWILVSIINTGSAQNGRGLLIMDSQNTPLGKEDTGKTEIITLIAQAFGFVK